MATSKTSDSKIAANITRRDFVGGTLIGTGAALLGAAAPIAGSKAAYGSNHSAYKTATSSTSGTDGWTGYAGVGDYARANGNTADVRTSAHLIRDGLSDDLIDAAEDTGEVFDMIIIGGGFSGAGAAYQLKQAFGTSKKCLILDNHGMFGGEAKQNEFEVDGYRIFGPQGSNGFLPPTGNSTLSDEVFRTVGMPMEYSFVAPDPARTSVRTPLDSYDSMFWGERKFDTGYFFQGRDSGNTWVKNPWDNDLKDTPWDETLRADLNRAYSEQKRYYDGPDFGRWLDSMTYKDYLEGVMGLDARVTAHLDPLIAIGDFGLCSDVISAYAAQQLILPGLSAYASSDPIDLHSLPAVYSFPGGNSGYFRHIVKYLNADAIEGEAEFSQILSGKVNFAALDRPENAFSYRLNATVFDVCHDGAPDSADLVSVTYGQNGRTYRIKAKTVVVSVGGWVARRIVRDMPETIRTAYESFYHAPVLVVNVALRNWQFLNKMGISSARWFEGFGTFCSIRRPMETGSDTQPFDPDKPTVLTFYVPFTNPGEDIATQGSLGRQQLLSKSYSDYETEILDQMTMMFADAGFDAARDVAGIVLNRWGHAYVSPQPGFYYPADGSTAPKDIVRAGFGRIQFGHSELGSRMNYRNAITEGGRAADALIDMLKPAVEI